MIAREINSKQMITTHEKHSSLTQEGRRNREITIIINNKKKCENINKQNMKTILQVIKNKALRVIIDKILGARKFLSGDIQLVT
jgi:hypothetical protein